MKFGHDIPRVVRYTSMTSKSSIMFFQIYLDPYTLERQKAVSAYLQSEQILPFVFCMPMLGTDVCTKCTWRVILHSLPGG